MRASRSSRKRVDTALEAIARQTEGAMIKLGLARADLGTLYRERIAPAARRKRELASIPDRPERFPLFLASGLGFAFAGCWPAGRFSSWRRIWSPVALALLLATLSLALLGAGQGEAGQGSDAGQAPPPRPRSARDGGIGVGRAHLARSVGLRLGPVRGGTRRVRVGHRAGAGPADPPL